MAKTRIESPLLDMLGIDYPIIQGGMGPFGTASLATAVSNAGGVCDGATFAASLALGAAGVYMGTRLIATEECDFHEQYKEALVNAAEHGTVVVPSLLGPARHLNTPYTSVVIEAEKRMERGELSQAEKVRMVTEAHTLAQETGDFERGLFMGGMCSSRVDSIPTVKELIDSMVDDAAAIINELRGDVVEG